MTHLHIPVPAINRGTLARTYELKMTPCKLSWSPMVQYFFENFWMIFRMFLMYENGRGMFNILEKLENIGFGGC